MKLSRRNLLKTVGVAALASSSPPEAAPLPEMHHEGPETPKLCLPVNGSVATAHFEEADMCEVAQLGVNHVAIGGPAIPWQESQLRAACGTAEIRGLNLSNLMIGGFPALPMDGRGATRRS